MLGIGHRVSIAEAATIAFLAVLGGCAQGSIVPPPPIAYQRPAHPVRNASRPRMPPQAPGQNAAEPASAPALSEEDKASLFQRFDAWENERASTPAPVPSPVAGAESNP